MNIAVPLPAFALCKQIPHLLPLLLLKQSLDLRREKLAGDFGEEREERLRRDRGLPFLLGVVAVGVTSPEVMHWRLGLAGRDGEEGVATAVAPQLWQRRVGLAESGRVSDFGVDGLEKKPNLEVGFARSSTLSSVFLCLEIQNVLFKPFIIFKLLVLSFVRGKENVFEFLMRNDEG